MKWVAILIVAALSLLVYLPDGDEAHEQGQTVLTYYVTLEEGEERRDIDFGVITSTTFPTSSSTLTSSTTSTTAPIPSSSTTSATSTTTIGTTTPSSSSTTSTQAPMDPTITTTSDPTSTPTTRDRTVLVGVLLALTYWLWRRRPRE